MDTARTEFAPSQTVEGHVGEVIRGRFPAQLEQDVDQQQDTVPAARTAEAAGRIDVRDFSQVLAGLAPPTEQGEQAPPVPAPPAESTPTTTEPTEAAPAAPGTTGEIWRLAKLAGCAAREWTAERWTAEAERRSALRTERIPELQAARTAYRAARRADPAHTTAAYHRARTELRKAKRRVPNTLPTFAAKAGLGAGVLGFLTLPHVPATAWAWLGAGLAASAVIGFASLAAWVRRHPKAVPAIVPTEEEQRLLDRLQPEYWTAHGEERGLDGTLTGRPELTPAGITVAVRLDGKWTVGDLRKAEEHIRSLLGARTGLRMQVEHGAHGGWATLILRTRSAADRTDMRWTPGAPGLGLDTVTGEPVVLTPYGFRLVAGATGMGKSVTIRPWIAQVNANPAAATIYIDPKHQEYRLWDGKCRVEHEKPAIYKLAKELQAELARRQTNSTGTTWTPTREDPELVVIVDEGAAIVRMAKQKAWKDILDIFEEIATMGRAGKIWLIWATQYPTKEQGVPAQVVEMMLDRIALSVESAQADRVIFGDKAGDTGWQPSELPALPGLCLVKSAGRKPNHVRAWHLDDETVAALPAGIVWHGRTAAGLTVVDGIEDYADPTDTTASIDERVLGAVARADDPIRQADVVKATGIAQGTVSKAIKRLNDAGALVREGDRLALPAADEESETAAGA